MNILLGLGNPGPSYADNRHNIGFRCVECLARRIGVRLRRGDYDAREAVGTLLGEPVVLAQPRTWMNRSGRAAAMLLARHGASIADLVVIHDDVDLALGSLRVKSGGGHGGHNGLRSILEVLGDGGFVRVRLGIGRPESRSADLAAWVLSDFDDDEEQAAEDLVERGADAVESVVSTGVREAMNRCNAPREPGRARKD